MSANRYFDHLYIPPNSPLIQYLGISSGHYSGKYDSQEKKLFLKKRSSNEILSGSVTPEQLLFILTMVKKDRGDKFTSEQLEIIKTIQRSSSFSGSKVSPHHHIIPLEVCKHSKLVIKAKQMGIFNENSNINKRPVPLYFHKGSHPEYSNLAEDVLEDRWLALVEADMEEDRAKVEEALHEMIYFLEGQLNKLLASGICTIRDI